MSPKHAIETLDQIEEIRRGNEPSLSLRQAANNARLPFVRCERCKGNGWTRATLLDTPKQIQASVDEDSVHIQYDKCPDCGGTGGKLK